MYMKKWQQFAHQVTLLLPLLYNLETTFSLLSKCLIISINFKFNLFLRIQSHLADIRSEVVVCYKNIVEAMVRYANNGELPKF